MAATVEQIAADKLAEEAIAALLKAYNRESAAGGATPVNWVIVVESITVDGDGEICAEHTDALTNRDCRLATAKGLLVIGVDTIVSEVD